MRQTPHLALSTARFKRAVFSYIMRAIILPLPTRLLVDEIYRKTSI